MTVKQARKFFKKIPGCIGIPFGRLSEVKPLNPSLTLYRPANSSVFSDYKILELKEKPVTHEWYALLNDGWKVWNY